MATVLSHPVRQQHSSMTCSSVFNFHNHFGFGLWPQVIRTTSLKIAKSSFSAVNGSSTMYTPYEWAFAKRCSLSLTIPTNNIRSYIHMNIINITLCFGSFILIALMQSAFNNVSAKYLENPYRWFCWYREMLIFLVGSSVCNQMITATACRPIEILYDLRYISMFMFSISQFFRLSSNKHWTTRARLLLLSPNLREPRPSEEKEEQTLERIQLCPSLAAGFPHFASGIWRNWGRDTFISLRGLLLLTGRYEEARYLILSYGGCLRHGLIPNLLADGKVARYNARDSVWWWLYSISNYTNSVPDGYEILSDKVSRLYPTHDSPAQVAGAHDQLLYDVIHEVLLRHLQLLSFRERGAGHSLDSNMNDEGFNNQIGVDSKTGFVFGGNRWNCGTWMDKMGSSEKASNKGHPATPRDGSAIELIALCRTTVSWLIHMNKENYYPYDSVETSSGTSGKTKLLLTDWLNRIDENFEKEFWIDESNSSQFVNRKQIYKDTINSTLQWTDYQLRPNFLIAAVIVWLALKQVETILLGKYGIKTLDPSDYNYVGDYVNDDDSYDFKRAHGFNYHNGPE
ncbi:unnamed protein product [Rotaria socialis]